MLTHYIDHVIDHIGFSFVVVFMFLLLEHKNGKGGGGFPNAPGTNGHSLQFIAPYLDSDCHSLNVYCLYLCRIVQCICICKRAQPQCHLALG